MDSLESTGQFENISALAVPIFIRPYLEYILKLVQNIKTTLRASLNIHNAVAASYQAGWINCVPKRIAHKTQNTFNESLNLTSTDSLQTE